MSTKTKILIFVGILTVVMVVQYFLPELGQSQVVRIEATGHIVNYNFDDSPSFHSNNSNLFYTVTRDGITLRTSDMMVRMSAAFSFSNPVMVARGDIVAVGERSGGRRVYVFDQDGLLFRRDFDDPVLFFTVTETGILTVVLQTSFGHVFYAFTEQSVIRQDDRQHIFGGQVVDFMTQPIVEMSADGRYAAIAILCAATRLRTTVELRYNNRTVALQWGTEDGFFASEIFAEQTFVTMRFMADNRLVVVTNNQIVCYAIVESAHSITVKNELWRRPLDNYFTHLEFYGNSHIIYVTGPARVGVVGGSSSGTVYILDLNGDVVGDFSTGRRVTHLSVGHGAVLVGADRNFHAVDFRSGHIWEHNTLHETRAVIFLDNTDTILVAGANNAGVFERRRTRVETGAY